ncbi:hypothetical protein DV737_g578, partial [Chaetothyriales sp. CBS 132003]
MYHFTSNRPKPQGAIDLTASPSAEKRKASFSNHHRATTFAPHQGPKKLVVKNLRTTPRIPPQQYLDRVWQQQDVSLDAIFSNKKEPYSLEELYKGAENVCRQGQGAELYTRLRHRCERHLETTVRTGLQTEARTASPDDFLASFANAWAVWQKQLVTIRQIFYYLDQAYLLRSPPDKATVLETGLLLFRQHVFDEPAIQQKVLDGTAALINKDRRGEIEQDEASQLLIKQALDILHELAEYSSHFEPVFRQASDDYFHWWKTHRSGKDNLADYAPNCTRLLDAEMRRCDLLSLDRSTRSILAQLFDQILITDELDGLLNDDAVMDLLDDDNASALEQLFTLLQRVGSAEKLVPAFGKWIDQEGTLTVFDDKHEADMVVNLLDFKRRLDHLVNHSFHKNDALGNAMHKSFETFINKTKKTQSNWDTDNAKPGEMIAKHIDLLLKGGVKAIPKLAATQKTTRQDDEADFDDAAAAADDDAEINHHLANALDLFRFVQGKAVFEAFYKKDLARRLLMGRSQSFDAERSMLTRLRNECGASFTHNLESMFKDMDLAREEMMAYKQLVSNRAEAAPAPAPAPLDLDVKVLSASAWPTYPDVPVNIPPAIREVSSKFEQHYKAKHSGRKLTWKHSLAQCQLRAKFPKGNKEILVSGFQAIVLLHFNDVAADKSLSYTELRTLTALPDAELRRTLQSLACAKYRVLTKHPRGRDINDTDTFIYNAAFSDTKLRIKINQIQLKETKEENRETHQRVALDRHYETQAAIVRIMKARAGKKVTHNELIVEVIKATRSRGVLEQSEIKKEIEKSVSPFYPPLFVCFPSNLSTD